MDHSSDCSIIKSVIVIIFIKLLNKYYFDFYENSNGFNNSSKVL
jgi:hypothetical protein